MKKLLLTLFIILLSYNAHSQTSFWTKTAWTSGSLSDMAVDGDDIYVASGSEIRVSTDKGETWTTLKTQGSAELVTRVYVTSDSDVIFSRSSTNAGKQFYVSNDGGSTWDSTFDASAGDVVTSFAETTNGDLFAGVWPYLFGTAGVCVSTNGGADWTKTGTTIGAVLSLYAEGNTVYAGTRTGKIYKTTNAGTDWTEVEDFSSLAVVSLTKHGSDYFAGVGETMYKSAGGDGSWSELTSFPVQDSVYSLLSASGAVSFIYAGTKSNEVWRSSNAGTNWTKINSGLNDDKRIWSMELISNDTIILGQDDGTYKSNFEATYNPPTPSAPTGLTADSDSLKIDLSWTDSQSQVTYNVYRKTSPTGSYPSSPHATGLTAKSYTDNIPSAQASLTYYYVVKAVQVITGDESANSNEANGKSTWEPPTPPDAPTGLTAQSGNATVELSWGEVSGTNISYKIYRSTQSNGYNFSTPLVEDVTETSYTDNSVTNEIRYYYVVRTYNDSTQLRSTQTSNEASALPVKPDPEAPENLSVSVADPDVVLTWDPSPTGDITYYRIYQSSVQGTGYTLYDSVAATETSHTFTPQRDVTYYYTVVAWDDIHESEMTNEVDARLETLELYMTVTPTSRYRVDQTFDVEYEINVKDQADKTDIYDLEIVNDITGNTDNFQTNDQGYYKYDFTVPVDAAFGDYSVSFTVTKAAYVSSSAIRDVTVVGIPRESNDWAVLYKENDKGELIFAMADTNNKWQYPGIPGKLRSGGNDVWVNNYLMFVGDSVEVDTTTNTITSWDGEWFVNTPEKYTLFKGSESMTMDYGNGNSMTFTYQPPMIEEASQLFGVTLYPSDLTFSGGLLASGINLNGFFRIDGVLADCDDPIKEIEFTGFTFTEEDINMIGAQLPALSPDAVACFENLQLSYQKELDRLDVYGDFSIPWLTLKGYAQIQAGTMGTIQLTSELGMSAAIGETGMTLYGATGTVSGINLPPMAMSLSGTLQSVSSDWLEVDFDGYVDFPQKIFITGTEARIIQDATFGNWQIVGPMNGKLNVSSHLDLSGDIYAGNFGDDQYVFEGSGSLKYMWKPSESLRGGLRGEVTVIDFPDQFPFDLIELFWEGSFPIKLKNAVVHARDKKFRGNLVFGGNIGTLNFTLDLTKNYGEEGFFDIGTGAMNMNAMIRNGRGKKDDIQAWDPYKYEGQGLPLWGDKSDKPHAINSNDTLNLTGGMDKVFIRIMSDTQVPGSSLVDPSGAEHTEDDIKDTSHVVFRKTASSENQKGYWVIKGDFEEGDWIAKTDPDETETGDFRDVFATFESRDMELAVSKDENNVTVDWNNTAVPDEPYVEFYLALDTNDVNGLLIGTTDEKDGSYSFTLTDSLPECLYYLYVLRYDNDVVDRFVSDVELWNNKANLQTPSLSSAVYYGATQKLVVKWTDPNTAEDEVQGYLIRVTYADETQEIIARPYAGTVEIEIDADFDLEANPEIKIEIAAYNLDGWESCWSTIADIVLDVDDYEIEGFESDDDMVTLYPNPMNEKTNVRFRVIEPTVVNISLVDVLGNELQVLTNDYYSAGIYDIKFNSDMLSSGTYYIKYSTGKTANTKLLIINK